MSTSDPTMQRAAFRAWLDARTDSLHTLETEAAWVEAHRGDTAADLMRIARRFKAYNDRDFPFLRPRRPRTALGSGVLPLGALVAPVASAVVYIDCRPYEVVPDGPGRWITVDQVAGQVGRIRFSGAIS